MIAIDWAHTKDFAVYDGKDAKLIPWSWLEGQGKKKSCVSIVDLAKKHDRVIIEHGAPLMYLYRLVRSGVPVYTINPKEVATERERLGLDKGFGAESDLQDAKIIYNIAISKDGMMPLRLDDRQMQIVFLYHQYLYSLKAQNATSNLKKAVKRHFGDTDNATLLMFTIHKDEYERRCENLKKQIESLAPKPPTRILKIKGMSNWLWSGIIICADPRLFHSKSAYRKWCGLIDRKSINHQFSRNASRIYYLCAEQFVKQRTPHWRDIYDNAKEELSNRDGYTHPHGGAMNRVMTAFANYVFDVVREDGIVQQGELWR